MMWGFLVILLFGSFRSASFVSSIRLHCKEFVGHVLENLTCATSPLAELTASVTACEHGYLLNVSWAVTIDSAIECVEGVVIKTSQDTLKCYYDPRLSSVFKVDFPETRETQIWFHKTMNVFRTDYYSIQVGNIPRRRGGSYKYVTVERPDLNSDTAACLHGDAFKSALYPTTTLGSFQSNVTTPAPHEFLARVSGEYIICGAVMVCVMLVLFGYVIYKIRGARLALDYEAVGSALGGPVVPVLVVYPAESELSQRAVGALAEFLQQHGGCSVAVDMWQQGSVAKLGPMRWLLEQVQAAHRVLIVAAQPSPEMLTIPGASIPAAAQDLYALALNLVAGQAKNSTDLAKFWVVRFRESAALTSELKACRSFSLMKDLDKLCRCLHEQDVNMKIADLLLRRNHCSRDATEKLRAAVQALSEKQGSATKNLNIV